MVSNFNNTNKKDDYKFVIGCIFAFVILVWICTPPGNKLLQVCFWGNNTKMLIAKMTNNYNTTEYIFHRNNAVYLAKMYPENRKRATVEMDRALRTAPSFLSENELHSLYRDSAYIYLYAGDYKKALNDFLRSGEIDFRDYLKVALLFKENGNYKYAISYCNAILNQDVTAYAGYACLADVYNSAGKPGTAIKIWDLALDRSNSSRIYIDRAIIKKSIGDIDGYNADIKRAKERGNFSENSASLIEETLHPKMLTLNII